VQGGQNTPNSVAGQHTHYRRFPCFVKEYVRRANPSYTPLID
jgi:hypothetical protein